MFPSYVLANLFIKGSLKNTAQGFELKLKNIIDSGTIVGLGPLTVDETSFPPDQITLSVKDRSVRGDQIASATPFPVYVLSEIVISVSASPLPPGEHKLGFLLHTREAGRMQFTVSEILAE